MIGRGFRPFLGAFVALFAIVGLALPAQAGGTRLITPVDPGSSVFSLIKVIGPYLSTALGTQVTVEPVIGDGGAHALKVVSEAAPDGATLLLAPMLDLEVNTAYGETVPLEELSPVAKLAGGLSVVLVVANDSAIHNFSDFAAEAAVRRLRLSSFGPRSVGGVARGLLVMKLGVSFDDQVQDHFEAIAEAVASGEAEAGLLLSQNLVISQAAKDNRLRPLVTFGARRSPLFGGAVPTFSEITGDRKDDFTTALAVYGPPGLSGTMKSQLLFSFAAIAAKPEVQAAAAKIGLRMDVHGPDVVVETMARDGRVLERVKPYMNQ